MAALVPYVGRLAMRAGLSNPYARRAGYAFAGRVAGMAARAGMKRGYRAVRRFARRPRAKRQRLNSRSHVGEAIGTTNCKTKQCSLTDITAKNSRTLYRTGVTDIPGGSNPDERLRNHVNLRGFKVCLEFRNNVTTPLYVNVAVLAPKNTSGNILSETDFFRDSGTTRAKDFSTALTAMEFHCLPVNTDDYVVLKHKRFRLGPLPGATLYQNSVGNNYKNVDWYIKLGRQVRYESSSSQATDGHVSVAYWCDAWGAAAGTAAASGSMSVSQRYITYWKEPKT
ncbi:capsid protein [Giant panda circovirus 2]|uniref:Capsid protein n=1 Tax=Giant panda circovirus 2 TaxID=2016457 RepID=A0A220IGS9_9CIRC|nr:capsid protein [Giant panda circovirus 2]ASH99185.1 capsid protein [Giant panda circovirus 2]